MDSMISAAAQLLAGGDVLGALKRVALRDDAPALALRGIAMAQLGELARARELLKGAGRAFGPRAVVARARCVVAEAEIALVSRDLAWQPGALANARAVLEAHGDTLNAAHARHLEARRHLLLGHLDEAARALTPAPSAAPATVIVASLAASPAAAAPRDAASRAAPAAPPAATGAAPHATSDAGALLPPALQAAYELVAAGIAIRRLRVDAAKEALERAALAARESGIPSLQAEVDACAALLARPAARLLAAGSERHLRLSDVGALLASDTLVIDACRHTVHASGNQTRLTTRPILFTLLRALAESWPREATRRDLVARAFRGKEADESHRARLRVEIGRLRKELRSLAGIEATGDGFRLVPQDGVQVAVLAPLAEEQHGDLLAMLADGEAWSSSALAIAMDASPRTIQRALETLAAKGRVHSFGRGPARRWTTPMAPGFPSTLLLPGAPPGS